MTDRRHPEQSGDMEYRVVVVSYESHEPVYTDRVFSLDGARQLRDERLTEDRWKAGWIEQRSRVWKDAPDSLAYPTSADVPWWVERLRPGCWEIQARGDAARLLMLDVMTPATFRTKRDALEWLTDSLNSHLPLDEDARAEMKGTCS